MRAFIAIDLENEDVREKIAEIEKRLKKVTEIKAVEPENLHITLRFLGEIEEKKANEIADALEACQGFGTFEIELRGMGGFPSSKKARVVWIQADNQKIHELKEIVDSLLERFGFERERDFVGHLTIARVKGDWSKAGKFIEEHSKEYFGKIEVKSLKLKQSILTPRGPIYKTIREVNL